MSGWTMIVRALLASLVGFLSLLASLCVETDDADPSPPVVVTVSDEPARAQITDESQPAHAVVTDDPPAAVPVVAAEAIGEARRRQGSVLDGSVLQAGADGAGDEFSSALARVAREEDISPVSAGLDLVPALVPSQATLEGSSLLRQAARQLEQRAADHEDLRMFEEADHQRRLATRLRREARRWDERASLTE